MIQFLSLFSGIGAFEKALDKLGVPYNLVNYCEIDKHASKAYAAIHGVPESLNLGDITKVDTSKLPHIDVVSYGFPCQDISLSGKMRGLFNEDGTQTRSGLFFYALRIIEDTKPKVAIAENVKNLVSKKFNAQFQIVLESLEQAGYNNYWQVLNAKDYGIPQNRERVFIVSIRKDIDTGFFKFPKPFELELRLKDLLEDAVDEKFYIDNNQMSKIIKWKAQQKPFERVLGKESVCPTLTARGAGEYHSGMITYSPLLENTANLQEDVINHTARIITIGQINSSQDGKVVSSEGLSPTHTAGHGNTPKVSHNLRIRKLTPLECYRLMGFEDEDFYRAKRVCSNTQLYKQAGNSIVVNVLEHLFKEVMGVLHEDFIDKCR